MRANISVILLFLLFIYCMPLAPFPRSPLLIFAIAIAIGFLTTNKNNRFNFSKRTFFFLLALLSIPFIGAWIEAFLYEMKTGHKETEPWAIIAILLVTIPQLVGLAIGAMVSYLFLRPKQGSGSKSVTSDGESN